MDAAEAHTAEPLRWQYLYSDGNDKLRSPIPATNSLDAIYTRYTEFDRASNRRSGCTTHRCAQLIDDRACRSEAPQFKHLLQRRRLDQVLRTGYVPCRNKPTQMGKTASLEECLCCNRYFALAFRTRPEPIHRPPGPFTLALWAPKSLAPSQVFQIGSTGSFGCKPTLKLEARFRVWCGRSQTIRHDACFWGGYGNVLVGTSPHQWHQGSSIWRIRCSIEFRPTNMGPQFGYLESLDDILEKVSEFLKRSALINVSVDPRQ
jgi:hypothetical protein